ncbi:hypothetical protein RCZAHN_37 [Rhodobacter phage RcZahn]|nr:hypothetical protein RCZAHN_37 [Rhodobacter phage RcZahn]
MGNLVPKLTVRATLRSSEDNGITVQTPALDEAGVIRLTPFVKGDKGDAGAAISTFTFQQSIPAMIWTIDHNLGFWPDVTVFDTAGNEVEAQVTNPTMQRTTINFSSPVAGTARLK